MDLDRTIEETLAPPPGDDPAVDFTLKLGQALHQYGFPAQRIEEMMTLVIDRLGGEGRFYATPTGIFASFGAVREQRTSLVRVPPGDVDLEKAVLLDELTTEVIRGDIRPEEGASRVERILAMPNRYGPVLTILSFAVASASTARNFGGGFGEMGAATLIGLAIGALAIASRSWRVPIFEPLAAVVASALALVAAALVFPISVPITVIAGLIVLLPGLTITTAMRELATRNLVSGTARMMGALLLLFEMGFGAAIGGQLYRLLPPAPLNQPPVGLPEWTQMVAVLAAAFAFTVLFRARPRDTGWVVLACAVGFFGGRAGAWLLGPESGAFVGALAAGAAANLYARYLRRPAAVLLVPALILLVPGSVGFVSFTHFIGHDVISGVETAFRMMFVAVALATGLLASNVVVPPRRAL